MYRKYKLKSLIIILVPITIILNTALESNPNVIEKFYSTTFNKFLRQALSSITGLFSFSLAEPLVFILLIILLGSFVVLIVKIRKGGFAGQLLNILTYLSTLYVLFMLLWGFNYNRLTFDIIGKIEVKKSSMQELYNLNESLIERANNLREKVVEDTDGVMNIPGGYKDIFNRAHIGYEKASEVYKELGGNYGPPKPVLLSKYMSYTGITGIYMPYTGEANVNINVPSLDLPATAAHEMAHQRGFAREDEANFIAYLTCTMHEDADFQYSGVMLALIHSMNALGDNDIELFRTLTKKYSSGLIRDLQYEREFWSKYEGRIEKAADQVNNSYLKSNGESDGIESYGRMVDLLLAEFRSKQD